MKRIYTIQARVAFIKNVNWQLLIHCWEILWSCDAWHILASDLNSCYSLLTYMMKIDTRQKCEIWSTSAKFKVQSCFCVPVENKSVLAQSNSSFHQGQVYRAAVSSTILLSKSHLINWKQVSKSSDKLSFYLKKYSTQDSEIMGLHVYR